MPPPKSQSGDLLSLAGLTGGELQRLGIRKPLLRRIFHLIPLRERYLLRLVHVRGASQRELAGLLGVSPRTVRRTLKRARTRLRNPLNLALVARWNRLDPSERRLVHLHRLQGIPLRRIARLGLIPAPPPHGRPGRAATFRELRTLWRRLERLAARASPCRRRYRRDSSAGRGGSSSSSG